jgi:hypothetical protein
MDKSNNTTRSLAMESSPAPTFATVAYRVFWMIAGPMALAALSVAIVRAGTGWLTGLDVAFFVILCGIVLARWLEFRRGHALTAGGEPASPAHLRRYALTALGLGLSTWVLANLMGNHWLKE